MSNRIERALSIRQPWAWAILNAGKDVENRSENMVARCHKFFGNRIYIHASLHHNKAEFEEIADFMSDMGIKCPRMEALDYGGLVGSVSLDGEVTEAHPLEDSPWFLGPSALILSKPQAMRFRPCKGQLNLFIPTIAAGC
jgi:hypothetical protein